MCMHMTNVHTNRVLTTDYVLFSCVSCRFSSAVYFRAIHHSLRLPFFTPTFFVCVYRPVDRPIEILRTALSLPFISFLSYSRFVVLAVSFAIAAAAVVIFQRIIAFVQCVFFGSIAVFVCGQPHLLTILSRTHTYTYAIVTTLFSIERYTLIFPNEYIGKQAKIFTKNQISHINRTIQHTYNRIIEFTPVVFVPFFSLEQIIVRFVHCFKHTIDHKHSMHFTFTPSAAGGFRASVYNEYRKTGRKQIELFGRKYFYFIFSILTFSSRLCDLHVDFCLWHISKENFESRIKRICALKHSKHIKYSLMDLQ